MGRSPPKSRVVLSRVVLSRVVLSRVVLDIPPEYAPRGIWFQARFKDGFTGSDPASWSEPVGIRGGTHASLRNSLRTSSSDRVRFSDVPAEACAGSVKHSR